MAYYFTTSLDDDDDLAARSTDDADQLAYAQTATSQNIELGRKIAAGNFGNVYYGVLDESIEVCIKFLKPSRSPREQETQIKNFQREVGLMRCEAARAVARRLTAMHSQLRHPNIMELTKYMSGGNLFHLIHSGTVQDDLVFVQIVLDVANAMAYLHACEPPVVHRDLTSPNVLIDSDWSARVSDFGLAKTKHADMLPSGQRGNLAWLAPETLHQCAFEPPSDVYSYGIILWEVVSRQVPFAGCSRGEVEANKRAGNAPGPLPDGVPAEFGQLIAVCLHVNPESRPTFAQIYAGLDALLRSVNEDDPT